MIFAVRKTKHRLPTPITQRLRNIAAATTVLAVVAAPFLIHPEIAAEAAPTSYVVAKKVVSDDLGRTSAAGWGTAPTGGSYSYSTRNVSFIANGADGVASLTKPGSSLTSTLKSVSTLNSRASTIISVPKVPSRGNGIYAGLQLRVHGGNYYQANIRFGSMGGVALDLLRVNGSTTTQTFLGAEKTIARSVAAGTRINLEVQAVGTNPVVISARAWAQGTTKPNWQSVATDSSAKRITAAGSVALWSYVSSGSSAQPVSFGEVSAFDLKPATPATPGATPTPTAPPAPGATPIATPEPTTPATSSPPSATPTTPDPGIDTSGSRGTAGAAPVGSATYAIPTGAIFVSANATVPGSGSKANPFPSVQRAIEAARSGSTIVLRAGTYHETVTVPSDKRLTIQSYPGEAVWFDGSSTVANWIPSGTIWAASGWNHVFDSSPTYTRDSSDGTSAGWVWLNKDYPMAAHPDQVWIGSAAQHQVASRSQVKPGTFYYDTSARTLYLGSNPAGQSVTASSLSKAISVQSAGSVLRGFGVRKYAPSVPDMAAVTAWAGGTTIENVAFNDNATTGLSVGGTGVTLNKVTVARNGMLGLHGNHADKLKITGLLAVGNNTEHFNLGPVSGGAKITRSRGVSISNSSFLRNLSQGLWLDESVYDAHVVNSEAVGNAGSGILVEISSTVDIVNNVVTGNGRNGVDIDGVSNVNIWNNTLSENGNRNLNLVMGDRRASNRSTPGHDDRQAFPDPTMSWITQAITVSNNVIAGGGGDCLLCVEDYSHQYSAAQLGIRADGNVYQPSAKTPPAWTVVWSKGPGNPAVYSSLGGFTTATGQESHGLSVAATGSALSTKNGTSPTLETAANSVARPLPSKFASLANQTTGSRHLGAW